MKRIFGIFILGLALLPACFAQGGPGNLWVRGSGPQASAPAVCTAYVDAWQATDTLNLGLCRLSNTWVWTPITYATAPTDGYIFVSPSHCALTLTTGTWAANSGAGTSIGVTPLVMKAQTGNSVLQGTTTAAANTFDVTCDITPGTRLTAGKGITITKVTYLLGWQTTAPTSTGTATLNSITYAAPGSTAQGTVAAIGGSLAPTGWNHSTPPAVTTSGQCYTESLALGTPYAVNTDLTRLTLQTTVAQSAASATVLQVCGAIVYYTLGPG